MALKGKSSTVTFKPKPRIFELLGRKEVAGLRIVCGFGVASCTVGIQFGSLLKSGSIEGCRKSGNCHFTLNQRSRARGKHEIYVR